MNKKIKLLIASRDNDYIDHLSKVLSERYSDDFSTTFVSSPERLDSRRTYDIFLAEPEFLMDGNIPETRKALMLCSNYSDCGSVTGIPPVEKYQRISTMVSAILEYYSKVAGDSESSISASVTAVWSPMGGCGKSTVAMALAAQRAAEGKQVLYLDLEPFSSIPLYFSENGRSISHLLENMDSALPVLIRSVRMLDSGSGVYYIGQPDNYEDISILTEEYIVPLINGCAVGTDEVILDLGSSFDQTVRAALDRADCVLLVVDATRTAAVKLHQFCSQSNVFADIREKLKIVCNRGAKSGLVEGIPEIRLPTVPSGSPVEVYKSLSAGYFT